MQAQGLEMEQVSTTMSTGTQRLFLLGGGAFALASGRVWETCRALCRCSVDALVFQLCLWSSQRNFVGKQDVGLGGAGSRWLFNITWGHLVCQSNLIHLL